MSSGGTETFASEGLWYIGSHDLCSLIFVWENKINPRIFEDLSFRPFYNESLRKASPNIRRCTANDVHGSAMHKRNDVMSTMKIEKISWKSNKISHLQISYLYYLELNVHHHLISPKQRKARWRIILGGYDCSAHDISITDEDISESFFLLLDSRARRIPCIPQYCSLRLLYESKADIRIIRFWESFEGIWARHGKCDDTPPWTRECIHHGCCHGDTLRCFRRIHHRHGHSDRRLRRISSEYISRELTESTTQSCLHITLYLDLSDDIARILSYLISLSLLDYSILRLLDATYDEECTRYPDEECYSRDDEKCIHTVMVSGYQWIAKKKRRKILPRGELIVQIY